MVSSAVNVQNLAVIDFMTDYLTPEMSAWKDEARVPYAASCARQIWYGEMEDFADFPLPADKENFLLLQGKEAYSHLLKVISGFESKRVGETHVRSQFYDSWRVMKESYPEEAKRFERLVGQLRMDANFVQNKISANFAEECEAKSALTLSGQEKGDKVLIVAGISRHGDVTDLTERMARVCENLQKRNPDFISVTHPTMEDKLKTATGMWKTEKKLRSNINVVPFDEIGRSVEEADRVYVLTAIGENPEADNILVQTWADRVRDDNTIVHLRGKPSKRGANDAPWTSLTREDGFISSEDVTAEEHRRERNNELIINNAKAAFDVCARLRLEGRLPKNEIPREMPELLASQG
ncbi:MAG: hypothetical protein JKY71_00770 [Alphaproteobacteria bacterium]|nr:hypothetical protein [Alphaproteobacteria bacterium]